MPYPLQKTLLEQLRSRGGEAVGDRRGGRVQGRRVVEGWEKRQTPRLMCDSAETVVHLKAHWRLIGGG